MVVLTDGQSPQEISNLTAKQAYAPLLAGKTTENTAYHRWRLHDQSTAIGGWDEWGRVCRRVYQTTMETKLQSFQFKILHAITPCRKFLKQIRVANDDLCLQCGKMDDLFHFFVHCSPVQALWTSVCRWARGHTHLSLDRISPKEIVLAVDNKSPKGGIINFMLLHFRFFVHRQKLFHDSKMDITHWLSELRVRLSCMERNLKMDGKGHLFKHWEPMVRALG